MLSESLVEVAVFVVVFVFAGVWAMRATYAHGRLRGLRDAMREMGCGVGATYQIAGGPVPDNVRRTLDEMRKAAGLARGERKMADAVARALRGLGREMGGAAQASGYHSGYANGLRDGANPRNGEIRVDLKLRDLLMIRWLAHAGFKMMMGNDAAPKFCFRNESDAQESNFALDRLEWRVSQEHSDPTAPHALALSRQQLIWKRWPDGIAAAAAATAPPDASATPTPGARKAA